MDCTKKRVVGLRCRLLAERFGCVAVDCERLHLCLYYPTNACRYLPERIVGDCQTGMARNMN